MLPDANDLLLFARVAECGSFSRAAERVGLPKSTVSRRISALETLLGERVLTRTTRRLALTDFGMDLLDHARRLAEEVDAAGAMAEHRQSEPSGRLRVSMPADFAALLLDETLVAFAARFPAIALDLDLSPRRVDLIGENFDLAIRMGDLPSDATLVARRVIDVRPALFAAPAYIARMGTPDNPSALAQHQAVRLLMQSGDAARWTLERGAERWEGEPPGQIAANSMGLLIGLAVKGAGIALLSQQFVAGHVARGELVRVLPEWAPPPITAWTVMPSRRLTPAKTRAFLQAIDDTLARLPPCEPGASSRCL
ncbi:LysR family transcriptional regulator [Niveibacterium umoris]|uniref:DNA-binding transcriptional LysR family regulator n=1 Tax=Niveibacterium umoris TaxID=1193620 RepID=A0A840BMU0_9RHOO|nr:LysR family transcriptional regulator [Niveibacterium umoris]MBB4012829.1 DNA-binding transcriptional LysR family regulator [Niveibacterium umoris]